MHDQYCAVALIFSVAAFVIALAAFVIALAAYSRVHERPNNPLNKLGPDWRREIEREREYQANLQAQIEKEKSPTALPHDEFADRF